MALIELLLTMHGSITKRPPYFPNNYLPVTAMSESFRNVTNNQDMPILNKRSPLSYG